MTTTTETGVRGFMEYGILCDRREMGLGLMLLTTSTRIRGLAKKADQQCPLTEGHTHLLKRRMHVVGEWEEVMDLA